MPIAQGPDGTELKFNPWHDPADGRFTFAGSGNYAGSGTGFAKAKPVGGAGRRAPNPAHRAESAKPRLATWAEVEASRAQQSGKQSPEPVDRVATGRQPQQQTAVPNVRPRNRANPAAEFVSGVGQGLYDVAAGTVTGVYSALTTNPVTTIGNIERGIAERIDRAIAAEDTPAQVQLSRAAHAVATASPRDIGRATGSAVGNIAMAIAPGAGVVRISALRRLRMARPSAAPFPPPQIGWVKENLGRETLATRYNDAATGARPGQAPTLMRTMQDGSTRPVKFDGVQGEYLIDRKWKVVHRPRAFAQTLRQSDVLAQHDLIGVWEVPNEIQRISALKMLKKLNVTNIKFRIIKP